MKRIGLAVAGIATAMALTTAPAHAIVKDGGADMCTPASRPAPVHRVENGGDGTLIIIRTRVTYTTSTCSAQLGTWMITAQHVREFKMYGRDVPRGLACQTWVRGRNDTGSGRWTKWHDEPLLNATNC